MEKSSGTTKATSKKRKASSTEASLPDRKKLKSKDSGKTDANKGQNKEKTKMEKDSSKNKPTFLDSSEVSQSSKYASKKKIQDGCLGVTKNDKGQLVFKGRNITRRNMEKSSGTTKATSKKRKASSTEASLPDRKKLKSKDSGKTDANKGQNKEKTKMEKDSSKNKPTFLDSSEVSQSSKYASKKKIQDGCLGVTKNDKGQLVFKGRNITRRNMEKSSGTTKATSKKRKASSTEASLPDRKKLKSKDSGKIDANKGQNKEKTKMEKDSSKNNPTFLDSSDVSQSSKDASKKKIQDGCLGVTKNDKGQLVFKDFPQFQPNMSPKEVLQAGSFGGTYFRPILSSVTKKNCKDEWKELPEDWLKGLNIPTQITSSTYRDTVNTYKVKCGGSLQMWESSGWIVSQDPYGWFQWYCRFYQGRRTKDDERQIGRWAKCAGVKGRWRNNLITKVVRSGCGFDKPTVSPVVRQTLQHWGYRLTKEDYKEGAKRVKPK